MPPRNDETFAGPADGSPTGTPPTGTPPTGTPPTGLPPTASPHQRPSTRAVLSRPVSATA
ncbi:MAG: hypothetical protein EXS06_08930 [Planctomycetaceae bacterium]|nr:hypothetical protein [Planctomycetaceae bacterium]